MQFTFLPHGNSGSRYLPGLQPSIFRLCSHASLRTKPDIPRRRRCAELRSTSLLRLADLAISCPSRGTNSGGATPAPEMRAHKAPPGRGESKRPSLLARLGCGALLLDYGANSTTPFLQPFPPAFRRPSVVVNPYRIPTTKLRIVKSVGGERNNQPGRERGPPGGVGWLAWPYGATTYALAFPFVHLTPPEMRLRFNRVPSTQSLIPLHLTSSTDHCDHW